MNLTPYVIAWMLLGAGTLGLALYRKFQTMKEDDYIHIEPWRAPQVAAQQTMAHKFHTIDRVGELLSVLTVLGALALAFAWIYAQL
jgi:hypothetical protein